MPPAGGSFNLQTVDVRAVVRRLAKLASPAALSCVQCRTYRYDPSPRVYASDPQEAVLPWLLIAAFAAQPMLLPPGTVASAVDRAKCGSVRTVRQPPLAAVDAVPLARLRFDRSRRGLNRIEFEAWRASHQALLLSTDHIRGGSFHQDASSTGHRAADDFIQADVNGDLLVTAEELADWIAAR